MTAAFILHLEVDDILAIPQIAEELLDDISAAGHAVVSVSPWHRSTLETSAPTQVSPLSQQAGLLSPPTSPGR